jgi:exosortase E/protease (VPEID-CTERM system)
MGLRRYGPLLSRAAAMASILLAEIMVRGTLLGDAQTQLDYFPLPSQLYRLLLAWGGALAILTAVERSSWVASVTANLAGRPPQTAWLIAHFMLIAPVVLPGVLDPLSGNAPVVLQQIIQHVLFGAAVLSLLLALVPASMWRELLGGSSRRALIALLLATVAILAIQPIGSLWEGAAAVTFRLVGLMIGPFYPDLRLIPESLSIITDRIEIHIDTTCSGLEGMALMLVMCGGWLWYLRREFRFPRALLLLPIAAAVMFLLNSIRIAILTALAAQGHVAIATAGFHSQAGWIFFIGASFLVALLSRRISWLHLDVGEPGLPPVSQTDPDANATAALVLPLVGVLAAGMLTRAMSPGFDPLQWLRLPIAAALLLLYRRSYSALDWRFSWRGVGAGICVFGAWILAAHWLGSAKSMPQELAEQPALQRSWWIATRALLAIVIVPVVEELAFRGFLMRRLQTAQFSTLRMQSVGLRALLLSSILFGLSHGSYWLPGILAGLAFGAVALRTGRIGEAIAAHVTANALLTILVLAFDEWQYW